MSKKLATGSDSICLDVKIGSGAFCKTLEDARTLAKAMVEIGTHLNRDTKAISELAVFYTYWKIFIKRKIPLTC